MVADALTKVEDVLRSQGGTHSRLGAFLSSVTVPEPLSVTLGQEMLVSVGTCHKSQVCKLSAFETAGDCIIC